METTAPPAPGKLALYKPGQAKVARWSAYLLGSLLILLGVLSLYGTINVPGSHVYVEKLPVIGAITLYKLIAVFVFILGVYGLHLVLNRPSMVDLLIDTEQELKKVSWPSR